MRKNYRSTFFLISILLLAFSGCANAKSQNNSSELEKKYGIESNYFLGIKAESENTEAAKKYFKKALSSKSKTVKSLAVAELISLGNGKESLGYAESYYKSNDDDESLGIYLEELYRQERYDKILSLTKKMDFATSDDKIIFYRCAALLAKDDATFPGFYNLWCISKPFSDYHSRILSLLKDYPDGTFAFASEIARMESSAEKRDYGPASVYAKRILNEGNNLKPQVISVAGKSLLYGSSNYESNAEFLVSLLTGDKEVDFYLNFYAARLYSRVESQEEKATDYFLKALDCATTDELYDNALWYYLKAVEQTDLDLAVAEVEKYSHKWHDPNYFDDFFESISVRLLCEQKWKEYYNLAGYIEKYASKETVSMFFYTSGSLIENDFYLPEGKSKKEESQRLYKIALDGGSDSYHKLMAAAKLGLNDKETWNLFKFWNKAEDFQPNEEIENIFYGYIDYELTDYIYPYWMEHGSEIGLDCVVAVSEYLQSKIEEDSDFNYVSLRIAAKKLNCSEKELNKKIIELSFPRGFSEPVEKYSKEYKISDYIIYALIRMESFYSPNALSHAGATGLCQLMESTAKEIGKKINQTEYELTEPDTNIKFGTYYLAELVSRLENNPLLAICSYNAGIGKIRSKLNDMLTLIKRKEIPNDIFLEMLNIGETRNYGKNVSAAAAIYAYIYYGKSPTRVLRNIVGI